MSDVIIGEWRNGLSTHHLRQTETLERRRREGYRPMPPEALTNELVQILDAQELLLNELLTGEVETPELPKPNRKPRNLLT